jgi:hypothetical protein
MSYAYRLPRSEIVSRIEKDLLEPVDKFGITMPEPGLFDWVS